MRSGVVGEVVLCGGEVGDRVGRERDDWMVGWRRKRRSCCQRACCAIRRAVERGDRERG